MTGISFGGLASGLDTQALIQGLTQSAREPIRRIEQDKSALSAQKSTVQDLKEQLGGLADAAAKLGDPSRIRLFQASSTNADAVQVSAGGAANPGSFNINVSQLAQTQRTYSNGVSSNTNAGVFGTGTLTIEAGNAAAVDINIDSSMSLNDIAQAINSSEANVDASVFYDGSSYRLQVSGRETGADESIGFTENGVSLGLSDPGNTVQQARDAIFEVDGFAVSRPTNTVSDAIPGVTLKLRDTTSTPATVEVSGDVEPLQEQLQGFVDTYNEIANKLHEQTQYNGVVEPGKLNGDATLRGLQNDMARILSTSFSGLPGNLTSAAELGIQTNRDGTLALDRAALEEAVETDPRAVAQLFSGTNAVDGLADAFSKLDKDYTDYADGRLTLKSESMDARMDLLDDRIEQLDEQARSYEERLIRQFTSLEETMSALQSQNQMLMQQLGGL